MKYRKKPVVVSAVQYTGNNLDEIEKQLGAKFRMMAGVRAVYDCLQDCYISIKSGDWIIKSAAGNCYPCHPQVFEDAYEKEVSALGS